MRLGPPRFFIPAHLLKPFRTRMGSARSAQGAQHGGGTVLLGRTSGSNRKAIAHRAVPSAGDDGSWDVPGAIDAPASSRARSGAGPALGPHLVISLGVRHP
jgi:hypothetical protein